MLRRGTAEVANTRWNQEEQRMLWYQRKWVWWFWSEDCQNVWRRWSFLPYAWEQQALVSSLTKEHSRDTQTTPWILKSSKLTATKQYSSKGHELHLIHYKYGHGLGSNICKNITLSLAKEEFDPVSSFSEVKNSPDWRQWLHVWMQQTAADMQIQKGNHHTSERQKEIKDNLFVSTALRRQEIDNSFQNNRPVVPGFHISLLFVADLCSRSRELTVSEHLVLEIQESHSIKQLLQFSARTGRVFFRINLYAFLRVQQIHILKFGFAMDADSTYWPWSRADLPFKRHHFL